MPHSNKQCKRFCKERTIRKFWLRCAIFTWFIVCSRTKERKPVDLTFMGQVCLSFWSLSCQTHSTSRSQSCSLVYLTSQVTTFLVEYRMPNGNIYKKTQINFGYFFQFPKCCECVLWTSVTYLVIKIR